MGRSGCGLPQWEQRGRQFRNGGPAGRIGACRCSAPLSRSNGIIPPSLDFRKHFVREDCQPWMRIALTMSCGSGGAAGAPSSAPGLARSSAWRPLQFGRPASLPLRCLWLRRGHLHLSQPDVRREHQALHNHYRLLQQSVRQLRSHRLDLLPVMRTCPSSEAGANLRN